jgi:hypothetical protein
MVGGACRNCNKIASEILSAKGVSAARIKNLAAPFSRVWLGDSGLAEELFAAVDLCAR